MFWKIFNKFSLMNTIFVLTFATNQDFFIDIGSRVTPQNRINVNNTGTIERTDWKL